MVNEVHNILPICIFVRLNMPSQIVCSIHAGSATSCRYCSKVVLRYSPHLQHIKCYLRFSPHLIVLEAEILSTLELLSNSTGWRRAEYAAWWPPAEQSWWCSKVAKLRYSYNHTLQSFTESKSKVVLCYSSWFQCKLQVALRHSLLPASFGINT